MTTWNILYRGPLSSCNYACAYCPFAKTTNTREELKEDERALDRFATWVGRQRQRLGILITPWGEALTHAYYRRTMTALSHLPHVYRIAIQTNLSAPLDDLASANPGTLALWATFHPTQTTLDRFLARCRQLDTAGLRYSVGVVGLHEHTEAITALRQALRPEVYLWINAFKRQPGYYGPADVARWLAVDPYFQWNLKRHPSAGQPCRAGETTFTVDGSGHVRRCHFLKDILGNIYEPDFPACLKPRPCSAETCGCHIGYIHQPALRLDELYGDGLLERIPAQWPKVNPAFAGGMSAPS